MRNLGYPHYKNLYSSILSVPNYSPVGPIISLRSIMSSPSKKSYTISIRTSAGLPDKLKNHLIQYFSKKKFCQAWIEKEGVAQHMHAQIWLDKKVFPSAVKENINVSMGKVYPLDPHEKKHAVKVDYACSNWKEHYFKKGKKADEYFLEVIDNPPPDETLYEYKFDLGKPTSRSLLKHIHSFWEFYKIRHEHLPAPPSRATPTSPAYVTLRNVTAYLADAMFMAQTIPVITRLDARIQLRDNIFALLCPEKSESMFFTVENWKQEQNFENLKNIK